MNTSTRSSRTEVLSPYQVNDNFSSNDIGGGGEEEGAGVSRSVGLGRRSILRREKCPASPGHDFNTRD